MREVQNAKQVVNNELSSLGDMFRKYNRDEDKDDEGNKGRGGKKRKPRRQKSIDASGNVFCFKSPGLLMASRSWPSLGSNVTGFRIVCTLVMSNTGASGNKRLDPEGC